MRLAELESQVQALSEDSGAPCRAEWDYNPVVEGSADTCVPGRSGFALDDATFNSSFRQALQHANNEVHPSSEVLSSVVNALREITAAFKCGPLDLLSCKVDQLDDKLSALLRHADRSDYSYSCSGLGMTTPGRAVEQSGEQPFVRARAPARDQGEVITAKLRSLLCDLRAHSSLLCAAPGLCAPAMPSQPGPKPSPLAALADDHDCTSHAAVWSTFYIGDGGDAATQTFAADACVVDASAGDVRIDARVATGEREESPVVLMCRSTATSTDHHSTACEKVDADAYLPSRSPQTQVFEADPLQRQPRADLADLDPSDENEAEGDSTHSAMTFAQSNHKQVDCDVHACSVIIPTEKHSPQQEVIVTASPEAEGDCKHSATPSHSNHKHVDSDVQTCSAIIQTERQSPQQEVIDASHVKHNCGGACDGEEVWCRYGTPRDRIRHPSLSCPPIDPEQPSASVASQQLPAQTPHVQHPSSHQFEHAELARQVVANLNPEAWEQVQAVGPDVYFRSLAKFFQEHLPGLLIDQQPPT
eukprot:TRINITY_DN25269_c0_g1_i1.p1 TRINITY_DN25269_c0_g1~~TRINITY_DN25269_c0_g1_i1.p1  ORF type:complete len:559 (-),score=86.16 TRINITY_DN25269_c0_g1_i1:104-1696(-)